VIAVDIVCGEAVIGSVRMASAASLFGTGTCTFGRRTITPNQLTLQSQLCGENQGARYGKPTFVSLDKYMRRGKHVPSTFRSSEESPRQLGPRRPLTSGRWPCCLRLVIPSQIGLYAKDQPRSRDAALHRINPPENYPDDIEFPQADSHLRPVTSVTCPTLSAQFN
jgi:hypothetical protein